MAFRHFDLVRDVIGLTMAVQSPGRVVIIVECCSCRTEWSTTWPHW